MAEPDLSVIDRPRLDARGGLWPAEHERMMRLERQRPRLLHAQLVPFMVAAREAEARHRAWRDLPWTDPVC